jgi:hypothetical protein
MSTLLASLHDRINAATSREELGAISDSIWRIHWPGELSDNDAQFLAGAIEKRKPQHRPVTMKAVGALQGRISRFTPRQRPRSPDRKASRDRRRTLGSSSSMPPALRALFTEGQRAVLAIVCGEVKHHGTCELPYDKIAALAGVCRTTVQTTMHEARRLGLANVAERSLPGRKNLTNVIRIMSREWLAWLKRGPTAHRPPTPQSHRGGIGSNSVKMVSTTKNTDLRKEEAIQETRGTGPSNRGRSARRWRPKKGNAYARIALWLSRISRSE